jgi:hypothetical protein
MVQMAEVLRFIRGQAGPEVRDDVVEVFNEAKAEFERGGIRVQMTLWGADGIEEFTGIAIERFPDEAEIERAVELSSLSEFLPKLVALSPDPNDVREFLIAGERGANETEVPVGGWMSLSIRQADPGLGRALDAELSQVLDEIAALDGFLGSIHGRNIAVREEVASLAFWKDQDAFLASLPKHTLFDVEGYERLA